MDLVVEYEERSTVAIKSMLGTSISKGDILFYGLAVLGALFCSAFKPLSGARALLIVVIALSLAIERTVMERWKHLLDVDADGRVRNAFFDCPLPLCTEHPSERIVGCSDSDGGVDLLVRANKALNLSSGHEESRSAIVLVNVLCVRPISHGCVQEFRKREPLSIEEY